MAYGLALRACRRTTASTLLLAEIESGYCERCFLSGADPIENPSANYCERCFLSGADPIENPSANYCERCFLSGADPIENPSANGIGLAASVQWRLWLSDPPPAGMCALATWSVAIALINSKTFNISKDLS